MLTALLIVLLILPLLLLADKIKRNQREKHINDVKSGRGVKRGKSDPVLQKQIRDEFIAETAPYLDIVDPKANLGLVIKQLRDKYEPGVEHKVIPESTCVNYQRIKNYVAVVRYSWHKANIPYTTVLNWCLDEVETKEQLIPIIKEKHPEFPVEQIEVTFDDMENKHKWFMERYNKKCKDYWLRKYGNERRVIDAEPTLFFAGEDIYEVLPFGYYTDGMIPLEILREQCFAKTREEFEQFLIDNPEIWCRIKKVTEFFEDCPLLPPLLPRQLHRKYRTLRQRMYDSLSYFNESGALASSYMKPRLAKYGITELVYIPNDLYNTI